jgi:peptidase M48-like protein
MSDALVVIALAIASSWAAAAILGVAARGTRGLHRIRLLFGSTRGALLAPPLVGLAVAASAYASHRSVLVQNRLARTLVGDQDGCLHWLAHATGMSPTAWSLLLSAVLLVAVSIPGWRALSRRRSQRALLLRIDRRATRRVRGWLRPDRSAPDVFAARDLERVGALSTRLGRRDVVLVPTGLAVPEAELAAIVAHERSHLRRRHALRRWVFETLLAVPAPRLLLGRCLEAAREEEEWEADDDASSAVGDPLAVARALFHATEAVVSARAARRSDAALGADGDIRGRVERLLRAPTAPPSGFARALGPSLALAGAFVVSQLVHPVPGLWAFCQVEQLLGLACG